MDYWINKNRQLMANRTMNPVHCQLSSWERGRGFNEGLFLKKKEVEWLIKILPEIHKEMIDE